MAWKRIVINMKGNDDVSIYKIENEKESETCEVCSDKKTQNKTEEDGQN
jgi:hypothetical protein